MKRLRIRIAWVFLCIGAFIDPNGTLEGKRYILRDYLAHDSRERP